MILRAAKRKLSKGRVTQDDIIKFYRGRPGTTKVPFGRKLEPYQWTLTNAAGGIGDSVMMTDICLAHIAATAWIPSPHFTEITKLNPYHKNAQRPFMVSLSTMQQNFDLGPGHNFQRVRRLFNLPVDPAPKGCIIPPKGARKRKLISLHLVPGPHVLDQQRAVHPRAREVYPENLKILRKWISKHSEFDFIEVGGDVLADQVRNTKGWPLADVVQRMASCVLHIGIISGPYHIAHALGVRTICIINFPAPWMLMLPVIKNVDVVEAEWLYPQSHILHQDHDSRHWPKFSEKNLEAAFQMETYPYEDPKRFLEMISA
jgi:hypothetical protein